MINLPEWKRVALPFLGGALLPFAFAPFHLFPLAFLALIPLFLAWEKSSPAQAMKVGFIFGFGQFLVGVSWVYVAIHDFGHSDVIVASILTLLFVSALALFPALIGFLAVRSLNGKKLPRPLLLLLWFPAWWTLGEWLRGWLFTGFPWLSLGYSQIDSPLAGYAPLLGVFGLSWFCAVTTGAILCWWRERKSSLRYVVPLLLLIWGGGALLTQLSWSEPSGEPISVTLIQGNVPQATKWDPDAIRHRLLRYAELSQPYMGESDLIVWPENAVTVFYSRIKEAYFDGLEADARATGTDFILGVPLLDEDGYHYYTTMMTLGSHHAFYSKRHLVPFGEFLPFESLLRGLINFFDMPMSSFSPGKKDQPLLQAAGQKIAASVCYEDAFGDEIRDYLPAATLLVNGSNNAWYGDSLAPHQHLQISRMRALEFGRPMLRATTNGISAIINPQGKIDIRSQQFVTDVISETVQPMQGETPYNRWGNWLVVMVIVVFLVFSIGAVRTVK